MPKIKEFCLLAVRCPWSVVGCIKNDSVTVPTGKKEGDVRSIYIFLIKIEE
jgi:hypothetical protein